MRMKASLGMVGEFCTMIPVSSDCLRGTQTAIWTGRLRMGGCTGSVSASATRAFGASDDPGSLLATSSGGTLGQAL